MKSYRMFRFFWSNERTGAGLLCRNVWVINEWCVDDDVATKACSSDVSAIHSIMYRSNEQIKVVRGEWLDYTTMAGVTITFVTDCKQQAWTTAAVLGTAVQLWEQQCGVAAWIWSNDDRCGWMYGFTRPRDASVRTCDVEVSDTEVGNGLVCVTSVLYVVKPYIRT